VGAPRVDRGFAGPPAWGRVGKISKPLSGPAPDHPLASRFVDPVALSWSKTELPGIDMKLLFKDEAPSRSTILFRMKPGAVGPLPEHNDVEQTYMLGESLVDEQSECTAGNFVWRPAGNTHVAHARNGAVFLSIFLKPNKFLDLQPVARTCSITER
jgi:ChrR Cupin-like domain